MRPIMIGGAVGVGLLAAGAWRFTKGGRKQSHSQAAPTKEEKEKDTDSDSDTDTVLSGGSQGSKASAKSATSKASKASSKSASSKASKTSSKSASSKASSKGRQESTNTTATTATSRLLQFMPAEDAAVILAEPHWAELCERATDFAGLVRPSVVRLLAAVVDALRFHAEVHADTSKLTLATPRVFRSRLNLIVEALREMHLALELTVPATAVEFQELANAMQTAHDDIQSNLTKDAQMHVIDRRGK